MSSFANVIIYVKSFFICPMWGTAPSANRTKIIGLTTIISVQLVRFESEKEYE